MAKKHTFTNRLIHERSPYLLQHAHNPVDWYPWGEEAFQAAKELNKPILLSIGYATCHWCHVMEKESFENPAIAERLNEAFINIKVDREELPDVDALYMEFAQGLMSGSGGWPLNVILTPDLAPFFASTYLPPVKRQGLMGILDFVDRILELWDGPEREKLLKQADTIVDIFSAHSFVVGETLPSQKAVSDLMEILYKIIDPIFGGFRGAPKFPIGYQNDFLLRYFNKTADNRALFLVERTLDMMQRGGIYDHLGGGFSRYATDEKWLVPHFEKMLYDNALLARAYVETYQITKRSLYKEIGMEILDYILRDMTHPLGGFFSAEDADSEGKEGLFYTWTTQEIAEALPAEEAALIEEVYGVAQKGNFEGRNILFLEERPEPSHALEHAKFALWKKREERVHPFKDDKILTAWNGLAIDALALAGQVFQEKRYKNAALKGAQFMRGYLWQEGRLLRRWRDGDAQHPASLEDYAALIRGLLTLFETGGDSSWLEWALQLTGIVKNDFKSEGGAFYSSPASISSLILRKCQFADGAEPSGNALHAENLLKLYEMTGETDYLWQAEDILKAVKRYADNYAPGYAYHLMNLQRYYDVQAPRLVITLNSNEQYRALLEKTLATHFMAHATIIWKKEGDQILTRLIPSLEVQASLKGKTALYICHGKSCSAPLSDPEEMVAAILKL